MDRRLLHYYNRELQHLREVGAEFAKEYPKIAARLGLEGLECADPYVERLLEGFGFLAARVQLKLDAEFPRFTQHLLESVYPGYLAPMPSMAIVKMEPDPAEGSLMAGVTVPRDSVLRSTLGKGEQTPCEYRTAHDVTLWPMEVSQAEYLRFSGSTAGVDLPALPVKAGQLRGGLRLRLKTTGPRFEQTALDKLVLHLPGIEPNAARLFEQMIANCIGLVVRPTRPPAPWHVTLPPTAVRAMGYRHDEALLPNSTRQFSGYRLLQEYFGFPQRFHFIEISGLQRAVRQCKEAEIDVILLFDRSDPVLEGKVDAGDFSLFCTPAVNLFPKKADRIHLNDRDYEYHVVPDRTRPMDFEVYEVTGVEGYAEGGERARDFLPFYGTSDIARAEESGAFFSVHRLPRQMSDRQASQGPRSGYMGGEVFVMLVDGREAPYRSDLRQLAVDTLCTNRDLPLLLSPGTGRTDFTLVSGAPVRSVRVIAGPTRPRPPLAEGETAWRLISHLSLNYLSLADADERQGAVALREMLSLYGDLAEPAVRKQIEGLHSVSARPVLRRVARDGMASWVRGLEITMTFDEGAFQGAGVFQLGSVLEQFCARYVSINSFSEMVVRTTDRGEIARWPARIGGRPLS
jgi:type VI secretion system protein ImpG